MIRTEERRVPLARSGDATVDGVVRVRRLGVMREGKGFTFERREPVGVVVRRAGHEERIWLHERPSDKIVLAFIAIPIAARLAAKLLTHSRRRNP